MLRIAALCAVSQLGRVRDGYSDLSPLEPFSRGGGTPQVTCRYQAVRPLYCYCAQGSNELLSAGFVVNNPHLLACLLPCVRFCPVVFCGSTDKVEREG